MLNGQDYMYQTNRYYHELWLKEKGEGIYEDYMIPNDDAADFKPRYRTTRYSTRRQFLGLTKSHVPDLCTSIMFL